MTTAADALTSGESPLGAVTGNPWVSTGYDGPLDNVGDGARATAFVGAGRYGMHWNAAWGNDQEATVVATTYSALDEVGVAVRCSTGGNGYYLVSSTGNAGRSVLLYKAVGNVHSPLATFTASAAFATGDSLTLQVVGSVLSAFKNGVSLGSFTDTTFTAGRPGLFYGYGNTRSSRIRSFSATDAVVTDVQPSGAGFDVPVDGDAALDDATALPDIQPGGAALDLALDFAATPQLELVGTLAPSYDVRRLWRQTRGVLYLGNGWLYEYQVTTVDLVTGLTVPASGLTLTVQIAPVKGGAPIAALTRSLPEASQRPGCYLAGVVGSTVDAAVAALRGTTVYESVSDGTGNLLAVTPLRVTADRLLVTV